MKNGIEKQKHTLFTLNRELKAGDKKTIAELYNLVKPYFEERQWNQVNNKLVIVTIPLTMSCFRFIMKRLIDEGKVKAVKKVLPSTGSKAPVYLISKKTTKQK